MLRGVVETARADLFCCASFSKLTWLFTHTSCHGDGLQVLVLEGNGDESGERVRDTASCVCRLVELVVVW